MRGQHVSYKILLTIGISCFSLVALYGCAMTEQTALTETDNEPESDSMTETITEANVTVEEDSMNDALHFESFEIGETVEKDCWTQEFILSGIGYPDNYDFDTIRERDLIHHSDQFLDMIINGVLPYAENLYSINPEDRTFCGASHGGYFMCYNLLQSDGLTKDVFRNYILASPNLYEMDDVLYLAELEQEGIS